MASDRTAWFTGLMAATVVMAATPGQASERSQLRVVGSSTVYPFSSYVAEELGASSGYPTPVIESTGSGGGMKLFCQGSGLDTPDITNASRRMKASEYRLCVDNGVTDVSEFLIGYDGIVIAEARREGTLDLTRKQLALAVAAEVPRDGELVQNPYERWSDIDPSLPDREIVIYGPPTTSGTRDAFEELVMEPATESSPAYGGAYTRVRQDGAYVPSGENDNLIVRRIARQQDAFGIFGYSFLEESSGEIQPVTVEGVGPSPETISSGEYPISRTLFFYTKNSHFDDVPAMGEYVTLFLDEGMIGPSGLLRDIGLIPLTDELRDKARQRLREKERLTMSDLQ